MLPRVVLALTCCILPAQAAHAGRLTLVCNTIEDHSGERMRRTLTIDPDRRVVHDNELTFTDRAPSMFAADLEEFVEVEHPRVTWGNRRKDSKAGAGVFTLDLATGEYVMSSRIRGRLIHGRCRPDDGSI